MTTIHFEDDSLFFSASSVVAFFGDGMEVPLTHVTFDSEPMGVEWTLSDSAQPVDGKEQSPRIVRLVMITPDLDWRKNVDYVWKLDNAWMSDADWGWLHWNSNSYIDSAIQLPSDASRSNANNNTLLECDVMEFHFESILPSGFRRSRDPVVTDTRVVLSDVKMGAYMDWGKAKNKESVVYNPCHPGLSGDNDCTIVDGAVSSSASVPSTFKSWRLSGGQMLGDWWSTSPLWQKLTGSVLMAVVMAISITLVMKWLRWCHHLHRTKRYQTINPTHEEEDLALNED